MNIRENFKMALDSIFANKMRSFLTMLGIIIGITAVIAILSVGNGATSQMNGTFNNLGATTASVSVGKDATKSDYITISDMNAMKDSIKNVERVSPSVRTMGSVSSDYADAAAIQFAGTVDEQYTSQMLSDVVMYGRYFNQNEYEDAKNVVVISEDGAKQLFNGRKDVVGEKLTVTSADGSSLSLKIVGVVKGTFDQMMGVSSGELPVYMSMPLTTMAKIKSDALDITSLTVKVSSKDDIEPVSKQVVRLLETRHDQIGNEMYSSTNFLQTLDEIDNVMSLFINFIAAVAAIALLVGGIGVMNIMLVSVTERTREIGTRKALGATTNTILFQFLMESVILSLIGGVIGLVLGILLANIIAGALGIVATITAGSVFLVLGFSSAVGIFFGIYPARKAAKLDPIEALRYE